MADLGQQKKTRGIILELVFADLTHEWALNLCLMLGIAAVIAPLLLLLGIKHGTITTLQDRLVQDPVNLEIRPGETKDYSPQWFAEMKERPEVGFVLPSISNTASVVIIIRDDGRKVRSPDLFPTGEGDPLILENGGKIPASGECVLTNKAAETFGVAEGDSLKVRITRRKDGKHQYEDTEFQVVSVLDKRAGDPVRLYAPLSFVIDVEKYKWGYAVPERNWKGGINRPFMSFDGVFVLIPEELGPLDVGRLKIGTGISLVEALQKDDFEGITGLSLPKGFMGYDLKASRGTINLSILNSVKNKLRGSHAVRLPYVYPKVVRVGDKSSEELSLVGLSLSPALAEKFGIDPLPWQGFEIDPSKEKLNKILLPNLQQKSEAQKISITTDLKRSVTFPLTVMGTSFQKRGIIPLELLAMLRTGMKQEIVYEESQQTFLLADLGFRSFRLYANSLGNVIPLAQELRKQGIQVIAAEKKINDILNLDQGLTQIFLLIAGLGVLGGISSLIASLYASVQRKKQEIGILRLIGFSRLEVSRFPIYQSLVVSLMSVLIAIMGYFVFSQIINTVFAHQLDQIRGQKICSLPPSYLMYGVVITTTIGFFSSLFAARKTTKIDPAEALRAE